MAKLAIKVGSTSQSINIFIQDSSSTTGAGLTGLVFNTAGLTAYYALPKAAAVSITLATLAAITTAYSSGGFKEVDATNMPGWYRLDLPDAAIASGRFVAVHLKGATNMAPLPLEIELTGFDNQSTTDGNLSKLTSLTFTGANKVDASVRDWVGDTIPARTVTGVPKVDVADWLGTAVTAATAGIPDTNAKNINNVSTASVTTINANLGVTQPINFTGTAASALVKGDAIDLAGTALTGRDIGASVLLSAGTGTGQLDFTSGVVKANLAQILGTALTETAGLLAGGFKKFFNVASPTLTCLGIDQTGDNYARLGAPAGASVSADVAAVKSDTAAIKTSTNTGVAPGAASGLAIVGSNMGTVSSVTGAVGSVSGNVGGNVTGTVASVVDLSTTTVAEPSAVPSATDTIKNKLNWLCTLGRNKITQTSTTQLVRNDGDAATIGTSAVSDDGTTFTRGKFS